MDKKISQLTAATTPLTGAEELAIVQSGVTKKTTIEDVKGYKVYTALLTQSGGDGPSVINGDEAIPLTIGVTYEIVDNTGLDVTNVGSPNNNIGTKFVATGTTPNSWGNIDGWGVLGYNTGAPVVTVLENTIGNIWWTYNGVGEYWGNSNNLFLPNKSLVILGTLVNGNYDQTFVTNNGLTNSICAIVVKDSGWILRDDELSNTPIEIRVYN